MPAIINRLFITALIVAVGPGCSTNSKPSTSTNLEGKEKPSLKATLEYIRQKLSESRGVSSEKTADGMITLEVEQTHRIKEVAESTITVETARSGWFLAKKDKANKPQESDTYKIYLTRTTRYIVKLGECDPDAVTPKKVTEDLPGVHLTKPAFELRLQTSDAANSITWESKTEMVFATSPPDEKGTTYYLVIRIADEKVANAVSKALQHAIKESGGKPSTTSLFEK